MMRIYLSYSSQICWIWVVKRVLVGHSFHYLIEANYLCISFFVYYVKETNEMESFQEHALFPHVNEQLLLREERTVLEPETVFAYELLLEDYSWGQDLPMSCFESCERENGPMHCNMEECLVI